MRLFLIFIITAFIGITSIQAQIETYDIKYKPVFSDDPGGYGDLQQISPTRVIARAGNFNGYPFFLALNSEGMIEKKWRTNFKVYPQSSFYRYDKQSNTLTYLALESISSQQVQLRLVLLDSNLTEKKNIILDSTITGMSTVFNYLINFKGITLNDSTVIWMSYRYSSVKGTEQIALHVSKEGQILSQTSIIDTSRYITHYPLFQIPTGEILFRSSIYDPKTKRYTDYLWTSDIAFHFASKPITDSIYVANWKYAATKDGGIILAYYKGNGSIIDNGTIVEKYDKYFKKKWTTFVPGGDGNSSIFIVESIRSGYYIATCGYDTVATHNYPEFKEFPSCFQDIVLSHIDISGKVIFNAFYGTEMCNEEPYGMIEDYTDGGIIIVGNYNMRHYHSVCESLCDAMYTGWLFKVDSLGEPAKKITISGINEKKRLVNAIELFPNPTSGILTVRFNQAGYFTDLEIIDISGHILQNTSIENNINNINVDVSSLPSGSYFCRLRAGSYSISRPFIIHK